LRLEHSSLEVSPEQGGLLARRKRTFNTASVGLGWLLRLGSGQLGLQLNLARRAPSAEELFSDGPHLATGAYERGDAHLDPETSRGLEATWRMNGEALRLEFNLFQNRLSDYIHFTDSGLTEEGLPLLLASQTQARIQGLELHLDWEWLHRDPYHLDLELELDAIEARDLSRKTWLPRTPPARATLGLLLQTQTFWLRPQAQLVAAQSKLAPEEEETEGYELLGLLVGMRHYQRGRVHEFFLRGENLGDELGFHHQSMQKERMPVAGRNLSLNYKLSF
jgi:iron complex outermembrane receptor protein